MGAAALPLTAAGAALNVVGTIKQGKAANAAGKYNELASLNDARETGIATIAETDRIRREAALAAGEAIAAQGAAGFALGTGSNAATLHESAINAELDILTARREGERKRLAQIEDGRLERAKGKAALKASYIGAAAQTLTAASNYAGASKFAAAKGG